MSNITLTPEELQTLISKTVEVTLEQRRAARQKPKHFSRDYSTELLELLASGPKSITDLRAALKTSETHLYAAISKLELDNKIEKQTIARKAIFNLKG